MDLWITVAVSTCLLMTAESNQTTARPETSPPVQTTRKSRDCVCNNSSPPPVTVTPPSPPSPPAPALGLLSVQWLRKCEGQVKLILSNSTLAVCHHGSETIKSLLRDACENKTGCEGQVIWIKGNQLLNGYYYPESGAEKPTCQTLRIQCRELTDLSGQLQAYKVVTALLCCVLLLLILIRFTRPTVKALQKRLSNKRQNRWVGPTQSHSVSYHRGNTVKNTDEEKRLSYPALERLTVSYSREPSSNRNSDCNF